MVKYLIICKIWYLVKHSITLNSFQKDFLIEILRIFFNKLHFNTWNANKSYA